MARGTTLGVLVTQLRLETRQSTEASHGAAFVDNLKQYLKRTQERLYYDFDWPHLYRRSDKTLSAGERYYDFPTDMNPERVIYVETKYSGLWTPVERGITSDQYNIYDSDDTDIRSDPVERWEMLDTGSAVQVEVWPIPSVNDATLRFHGIRKLGALTSESDTADLDDTLIVLFAASEILAYQKSKDAEAKAAQASSHYDRLKAKLAPKERFQVGGGVRGRGYPPRITVVSGNGS